MDTERRDRKLNSGRAFLKLCYVVAFSDQLF